MRLCLAMAVVLLATSAAHAKRASINELASRLGATHQCSSAARALAGRGPAAAATIPRLLDAVARGDACTAAAERAVAALVRLDNQAARAAAERIKKTLSTQTSDIGSFGRSRLVALFGRMARLRSDGQPFLTALIDDSDPRVARAAAVGLGANYPPSAAIDAHLDAMLAEPERRMRAAELVASAASCTRDAGWLSRAVELLALAPAHPSYGTIVDLVEAALVDPGCRLEGADLRGHPGFLVHMTAHENEDVAAQCARMLGRTWPSERIIAELAHRLVESPHDGPRYRTAVIDGLAQTGRKSALALELLIESLVDPAPSVRLAAIDALAVLGAMAGEASEPLSRRAAADPDAAVRRAAHRALGSTIGWPIEPRYPSRACHYGLPTATRVCCEPECPRWADLGTRATADRSRGVFAGIGVVPRIGGGARPSPSASDSARAALRRYLSGYVAATVRDYLRGAPRANRVAQASRAERELRLDFDPLLRSKAEQFADELLARIDGTLAGSAGRRAALVTVSVEELLAVIDGLRHQGPRDLVLTLEARLGATFDRDDLAVGSALPEKPDWVVNGSGWFVTAKGFELRGLGAAGPGGDDGVDAAGRAERRARSVLVDVLADFGARCLAEYRRDYGDPGSHLVTDAGWAKDEATVSQRWRDSDGRQYVLASITLADYLAFLARMPALSARLRRFCDARGEAVFRSEAVVLEENDAPVWPATGAPEVPGRAVVTAGNLFVGGAAQDAAGRLLVLTRDHGNTALLGLSPDGLAVWRRTADAPWRRAAPLPQEGFLVAGTVVEASADSATRHTFRLAHLSPAGEVERQESVRLAGWSELAGLWPALDGSMFLVAGDRAYGEGRHRKALLVRLALGGRVRWTREVVGWGAVSLPGVVPLADNGVVVLADAVHCLDPDADSGCDGDAMCDWNSAHARCGWNKSLTRYAADGRRVWHRALKLEGRPSNLVAVEGGYLFASVTPGAVELVRFDEEGQVSWRKTSEAPIAAIAEGGHALRVHGDRVVLVGVTTRGDVLVLEHGQDGEPLGQRRFGGRGRDVGHTSFAFGDRMLVLADSDSVDLPGAAAGPHSLYVITLAYR